MRMNKERCLTEFEPRLSSLWETPETSLSKSKPITGQRNKFAHTPHRCLFSEKESCLLFFCPMHSDHRPFKRWGSVTRERNSSDFVNLSKSGQYACRSLLSYILKTFSNHPKPNRSSSFFESAWARMRAMSSVTVCTLWLLGSQDYKRWDTMKTPEIKLARTFLSNWGDTSKCVHCTCDIIYLSTRSGANKRTLGRPNI